MRGSVKSKRVAWASDVNLCQARLFLSEECPSEVGLGAQDHLQAKTLGSVQSGGMVDDNLPPGFEGLQAENYCRVDLSQVPVIRWRCPPRFGVNSSFGVVSGEESKEIEIQNQREMRVLEAIYPRASAIPPNPSASPEDSIRNDQNTPIVPITAIEDEDATLDTTYTPNTNHNISSSHGNETVSAGVEPDVIAAAHAVLTSVINKDQGNLIDPELLIKILSDPKMVEQLVTNHGATSTAQSIPLSSMLNLPSSNFQNKPVIGGQNGISSRMPNIPSSSFQSRPVIGGQNGTSHMSNIIPSSTLPPVVIKHNFASTSAQYMPNLRSSPHLSRPELIPPSMASANLPFYPPGRIGSFPNIRPSVPDVAPPVAKDINYYKSLIQQHGGEKREILPQFAHQSSQMLGTNQEPIINNTLKSIQKIQKPCNFFNSPRGCRNGANCVFQHDVSAQQRVSGVPEVQGAKRVKLNREITGSYLGD